MHNCVTTAYIFCTLICSQCSLCYNSTMSSRLSIVLVCHFISVVQCSSIFTRSMIRTPDESLSSRSQFQINASLDPMVLTSKSEDRKYEIIYPLKSDTEQKTDMQSNLLEADSKTDIKGGYSEDKSQKISEEENLIHVKTNVLGQYQRKSAKLDSENHYNSSYIPGKPLAFQNVNDSRLSTQTDLKNIANGLIPRDFDQNKNLSSDLLSTVELVKHAELSLNIEKGFQEINLWEFIQQIVNCGWASGWTSCLHDTLRKVSSPVLQFLTPQVQEDSFEDYTDSIDKDDQESPDQDEGRKRLSKKLQSLVPLLLMLKMSMLPALAVMALVSGKAFLMSLLSLGVALISAVFSPTGILSASKRHEIASQTQIPSDPASSNYYYMK